METLGQTKGSTPIKGLADVRIARDSTPNPPPKVFTQAAITD
jgi:hypothetical protein